MAAASGETDVFMLYNEREEGAETVTDKLRARGLSVYFFRTDFPAGGEIESGEAERLADANVVVLLLGREGWGTTQRVIAERADNARKYIIPVLIGSPPNGALEDLGGLFQRRRWIDARDGREGAYDELANAVRQAPESAAPSPLPAPRRAAPRFDEIMTTLKDGSDIDRAALLARVVDNEIADRAGLAMRIREAINSDYTAGGANGRPVPRHEASLSSIRSWMLSVLIRLDPLSADSRALILRHLEQDYEPETAVRFWTLAGIVQGDLPYLNEAVRIARHDSAKQVAGLGRIVADPDDEKAIISFRQSLTSMSFEEAWPILRILRVRAIPDLAREVVMLIAVKGSGPAVYDALYALANPQMARAAAPEIQEQIGLAGFATIVLQEARGVGPNARSAFASALHMFDDAGILQLLREAAEDGEDRRVAEDLIDDMDRLRGAAKVDVRPPRPGHASEKIDVTRDDIGIQKDVQTLASVMLAKDLDPPLAIGLFGEWGSGKSFFMKSIEAVAKEVSAEAATRSDSPFCAHVAHIDFNAWHYVDSNLWASLVSHILERLAKHVMPEKDGREAHAALASDLVTAKEEMAAAEAERQSAEVRVQETAQELQKKTLERQTREVKLRELRARDLVALLEANMDLKTEISDALKEVGAPAALESIGELNKVVEESYTAAGRFAALFEAIFRTQNRNFLIIGVVAFLIAPPLVAWAVARYISPYAADLSAIALQITIAMTAITKVVRSGLTSVRSGLGALSTAKQRVDEALAKKRAEPDAEEIALLGEVEQAKATERTAIEKLAIATARAKELETKVAALEANQSLRYFIAERAKSDDYRRHLGLISMVRRDFDGLVERLRDKGAKADKIDSKPLDRIILYIDDVDRCPPHMVIEILQAVHLLLAYDLFVVVVSVDPRWLLRSLEIEMAQLKHGATGAAEGMGATPQDYLEKIFQIPFSVRPMGATGFGRLMDRVLGPTYRAPPASPESVPSENGTAAPEALDIPQTEKSDQNETPAPGAFGPTAGTPPYFSTPTSGPTRAPDLDELAEILEITPQETAFSRKLHMLIATPRGAKRFANIYRILKASVSRSGRQKYEGTENVPGSFQLPMLLLALLVGKPKLAARLFPAFIAAAEARNAEWWDMGWEAITQATDDGRIREHLNVIVQSPYFPHMPELLSEWMPLVARNSFTTANIFLEAK